MDNEIEACAAVREARTSMNVAVELAIGFSADVSAMAVTGNGSGMTLKVLESSFCAFHVSKVEREDAGVINREWAKPLKRPPNVNGLLGQVGVGAKQAAFFIGYELRVCTSTDGSDVVHEAVMSKVRAPCGGRGGGGREM